MGDQGHKVFVGSLPGDCTEDELRVVFSTYGEVVDLALLNPSRSSGQRCALITYSRLESAEQAIQLLNRQYKIRADAEKPIDVRWPQERRAPPRGPGGGGWAPTPQHGGGGGWSSHGAAAPSAAAGPSEHKLFVGNLPPGILDEELRHVFGTYGELTNTHIMRPSPTTGQRCAFVAYSRRESAEQAMELIHGKYKIRTDPGAEPLTVKWANERGGGGKSCCGGGGKGGDGGWQGRGGGGDFRNGGTGGCGHGAGGTRLYVANLPEGIDSTTLEYVFKTYGSVANVHVMGQKSIKGCVSAFVDYGTPREAEVAIATLHDKYEIQPGLGPITVKHAASKGKGKGGFQPY
ncbi:unnamed protein product [Prorocentrum cordatum]|uniref:RRM domain-containing protein n=1 Tax=Prorocentrum cordatum TaxID=2364126 RepID=A0ABN9S0V5_9DINO|nr:unnamed protein product [Polarella glacialis]